MRSSLILPTFLLVSVGLAYGLNCYQCGSYTDGLGSITPCMKGISEQELKSCKSSEHFCIKFVSNKGLVVRQCASQCVPTEQNQSAVGETRLFCCQEDGCNVGTTITCSVSFVGLLVFCVLVWWFVL